MKTAQVRRLLAYLLVGASVCAGTHESLAVPIVDARFESQTALPATLTPGQTVAVQITMTNTGQEGWISDPNAPYGLGSQNPIDNTNWVPSGRVYLTFGDYIPEGTSKSFTFNITAPMTPGVYNFQWQMVHQKVDGPVWFGALTPNISITVQPTKAPNGLHDTSDCAASIGWACDPDNYTTALAIHIYADGPAGGGGTLVGGVTANLPREASVASACGGTANHGFSFPTPASLKDGNPHTLYTYAINIGPGGEPNPLLINSPKSISCTSSPSAPVITLQPSNQSVAPNNSATFTMSADGNPAPTYQWIRNGIDIPGANTATHVTPPTTLADNGAVYKCRVTNTQGQAETTPVTLTVTMSNSPPSAIALNNASAYPVPYRPASGHGKITFTNLGNDASVTIKIYTITGELVKELRNSGAAASLEWSPVSNENGETVASGVYIYQIKNNSDEKRGKLVVSR